MKRNIFTKSMIRQPLRTALLFLLLIVAAFSFSMRSMEYIVINEQINEIGGYYRAVGYLVTTSDNLMYDIRPISEIISGSPHVSLDDKRRNIEAVLVDMTNTGFYANYREGVLGRNYAPDDAFFTGTLTGIRRSEYNPFIVLSINVDTVLQGYPEHVEAGQTLDVHYFMDLDEIETGSTEIDGMVVGERYFLRGVLYHSWTAIESASPSPFRDVFVMHPLSDTLFSERSIQGRDLLRGGVWYVTAPTGETVDFMIPGLENLNEEMRWCRFAQSIVTLQTTEDMSYMPFMQPKSGARGVLTEGRWVNSEDNELSRPVVAVHDTFASKRGLSIGDTLRIGIPPEQQPGGGSSQSGDNYIIIEVIGEVFEPLAYILELEIVGLFDYINASGRFGSEWATTLVYIPDSVLPPDVNWGEFEYYQRDGEEVFLKKWEKGFIASEWYSFTLHDPRDMDAFMLENRDIVGEMGFNIDFMPAAEGAKAFWETAETILQTVRFNLLLFSIVSLLVLVLTVFLYIRQRHRDYAILRALGNPARRTNRQLITTLLLFALPAVLTGGVSGWFVALSEASKSLGTLPGVEQAEIDVLWLPLLIAVLLIGLFILAVTGILLRRRPILEMLQGGAANRMQGKTGDGSLSYRHPEPLLRHPEQSEGSNLATVQEHKDSSVVLLPQNDTYKKNPRTLSHQLRFIFRHIARQKIKTLLAAVIALFFVIALGYLQTAIINTEAEVDRLYNTTIVTGEVKQANQWDDAPGRYHNNVIRPRTIEGIAPFVDDLYIDACHEFTILTPANEDGTLPEHWDMLAGININANLTDNLHAFNTLVGVSDLERFTQIYSSRAGSDFTSFSWEPSGEVSWITNWYEYGDTDFPGMQINFIPSFDSDDFKLTEGNPVPIIMNNHLMGMLGYELGDTIYIGTSTMLRSWEWEQTPAIIIGVFNITRLTNEIFRGTILPLDALEHIIGNELRYMSIQFEIDPALNREMDMVRTEIEEIAEHISAGEVPLRLFLDDEELRMVVIPMEQNLSLLRLLYPVAIVLSAIIGLGLSMLLMQQNAKVAAIMRVLGTTISKSRVTLSVEQGIVCVIGLIIGLTMLAVLGWGFGFLSSLVLAGVYLAGAAIGTIVGAIVVTNKPPLELLQVKE